MIRKHSARKGWPKYTIASRPTQQTQQQAVMLTKSAMVSDDNRKQLSELVRSNNQSKEAEYLDSEYQKNRMAALGTIRAVSEFHNSFNKAQVLAIPDFTHGISPRFARHLGAINVTSAVTGAVYEVDSFVINYAVRPGLVSLIVKWIISHGKSSRFREFTSVSASRYGEEWPQVPEELAQQICFPDESQSSGLFTSSSRYGSTAMPGGGTQPLVICGPLGTGKSHLMFGAAAHLVSFPCVVVVYIGDASDLIVQSESTEQFVSVVEHIRCAFAEHQSMFDLVSDWYSDVISAHARPKAAMNSLLLAIRKLCRTNKITPVFFIDGYEKIARLDSSKLVFSAFELAQNHGFVTVVSGSNSNITHSLTQVAKLCVITGAPSDEDIDNIALATHPALSISTEQRERIYKRLDNHAIDVVSTLTRFSNYIERREGSTAHAGFDSLDKLQICINEQYLMRSSRVLQKHSNFISDILANVAPPYHAKYGYRVTTTASDWAGVVSTESGELRDKLLDIKRAVFAAYHGLELWPRTRSDLQFMIPDDILYRGSTEHIGPYRRRNMAIQLSAASGILYRYHFGRTAREQFQWLFDSSGSKYDVPAPIRVCFFDHSLFELERLYAPMQGLSGKSKGTVDIGFGRRVIPHLYCNTFVEAIQVAKSAIECMRNERSLYSPVTKDTATSIKYSTLLYFPSLGFDEKWMGSHICKATHHHGSFILGLTRTDKFANGDFVGYNIRATWIVNDPIKRNINSSSIEEGAYTAGSRRRTRDKDQEFGYENSWSAKAISIFDHICQRGIFGTDYELEMLVLAPKDRVDGIIRSRTKLRSGSHDTIPWLGLVTIESVDALKAALEFV